jgi:hypothetical protein
VHVVEGLGNIVEGRQPGVLNASALLILGRGRRVQELDVAAQALACVVIVKQVALDDIVHSRVHDSRS